MILRYLLVLFVAVFTVLPGWGQSLVKADKLPRFQEHYVRDRETPSSIAAEFNITTRDFLMLNNFPSDVKLKPGQKVLIRTLKDGETAPQEAAYKPGRTDEAPVTKTEPVKTERTEPAVTKTEKAEPAAKSTSSNSNTTSTLSVDPKMLVGPNGAKYQPANGNFHVVQKGQTFYHIAMMYHLTLDQLKQLNNMTNTDIKVGQELRISKY